MADNQQTDPSVALNAPPSSQARRGRRRGSRGHGRKRGIEGKPTPPNEEPVSATAPVLNGGPLLETAVAGEKRADSSTPPEEPHIAPPSAVRRGPQRPSRRLALQAAKRHVQEIIESLQHAVEEMEQVQRLLDQAERERNEDLHDLELLRQALTRLQSPRRESRPRFSQNAG